MREIFLEPFNASRPDPESQEKSAFAHSCGVLWHTIIGIPVNLARGKPSGEAFTQRNNPGPGAGRL